MSNTAYTLLQYSIIKYHITVLFNKIIINYLIFKSKNDCADFYSLTVYSIFLMKHFQNKIHVLIVT